MIGKIYELIRKTKPGKRGILGFDIGSYSIKIAEIQIIKDEPILTSFIQGRTYKDVIINGIINDLPLLTENLKNILNNINNTLKLGNVSIPYEIAIFDSFKTEHLPTEEEIKNKINEKIPYKIEDINYSYYIMPKKNLYQIFYLVAKKEVIEKYEAIFKSLNCEINNMDVDFINLSNFIEFLYGEKERMIIDWGDSKVKILFCDAEAPVYSREIFNLGLKDFKKMLIKNLKIDSEMAENLVVNPQKGEKYSALKQIYTTYIKDVLNEIEYTLNFVINKFKIPIKVAYIVGGGARIPNICEIMRNVLNIEANLIKIEDKIRISSDIDTEYLKIINTQGAVAVATSLKDFI